MWFSLSRPEQPAAQQAVHRCVNCMATISGPGCVPSGPDSAWHRQCLSCHEVAAAQLALAVDRPDGVPIQIGRCLLCGTTRSCRPGWTTRCMICLDDRTVEADADGHLRRAGDLMADTALTGRVRQALGLAEDAAVPYRVAREAASALVVAGRLRLMERPGWEVLATDVHGLPWYDSGQPCSHGTWGRHEKCGTIAKMTEGSLDCPSCGPEPGSRTHQARRDDPYLLYLVQTRKYQKFGVGDRRRVRSHIRGGAEVVQVLSGPFARVILAEKALKDLHRDAIVRSVRRGMIESFGQGTEVVRRHRRSRISLTAVMPDGEDVTHRFRALCAGSSTARTPSRASVTDLDDWLKTQAGQQERANNTRTFLAVEGLKVIGYYATTTYRLGLDEAAAMYGVRAAGISDPGAAAGAARGRRRLPGQRRRLEAAAPCAEGDCGGFPACRVRGRGGPRDRKRRRDVLRAAGLHPV